MIQLCLYASGTIRVHDRPQSGFSSPSELYLKVFSVARRVRQRHYILRSGAYIIYLPSYLTGRCYSDGAGLFHGILKHFIGRGSSCPKILAATHFHEIFRNDILVPEETPISFVHMQIMITSDKGETLDSFDFPEDEDEGNQTRDARNEGNVVRADQITYLYR